MSSKNIASHDYGPRRFKWLTLKLIEWQDPNGKSRLWESCERTTRASSGIDAVAIVVKAISTSSPPRIVLVSQYRPPLASICLELPAGLIDKGETAEAAAFRELYEETGLTPNRLLSLSPVCYSDPGMTNTNMQLAVVEVDLDAPINRNAEQKLDDGECIDIEWAPWDGLLPWLQQRKLELECQIDARLMSFAIGLDLGIKTGAESPSFFSHGNGIATDNGGSTGGRVAPISSIAALTEKNVAIKDKDGPNNHRLNNNTTKNVNGNNKSTPYGGNNSRSDSVQTDILQAMSAAQIQSAAKAYAETLEEFHAERLTAERASNLLPSRPVAPEVAALVAPGVVAMDNKLKREIAETGTRVTSATRASSSVISDGEGGEES